jgi:hypothetical protein
MPCNLHPRGEACFFTKCPHNVYYEGLGLNDKATLTEKALSIGCCMLESQEVSWTLEEIGEAYGLSRERVRQITEKTLAKILRKIVHGHVVSSDFLDPKMLQQAKDLLERLHPGNQKTTYVRAIRLMTKLDKEEGKKSCAAESRDAEASLSEIESRQGKERSITSTV